MGKLVRLDQPKQYFKSLKAELDILTARVCIIWQLEQTRSLAQLVELLTPDELTEARDHVKEIIERRNKI